MRKAEGEMKPLKIREPFDNDFKTKFVNMM